MVRQLNELPHLSPIENVFMKFAYEISRLSHLFKAEAVLPYVQEPYASVKWAPNIYIGPFNTIPDCSGPYLKLNVFVGWNIRPPVLQFIQ